MATMNAPATGEPMAAAMPWKSKRRPKAFVSLSKPNSSTRSIDRNEAKQAVSKRKINLQLVPYSCIGQIVLEHILEKFKGNSHLFVISFD